MDPLTLGMVAGGTGLAQAGSGIYQAYQQRKAMQDQLAANRQAQGAITDAYGKAQGYYEPYSAAGQTGLNQLLQGDYDVAAPEEYQAQYQAPEFNYQQDPGMAYRMKTGQEAVQSAAAGAGSGLSGATLKALSKFGSNLGSQEYGNAFNRYMQQRQQGSNEFQQNRLFGAGQRQQRYQNLQDQAAGRYGRAAGLAGMGERAATSLGSMATGYGSNLAGLYGARGDINAAGRLGQANIVGQTIGGMGNTALDAATLGAFL